MLQILNVTKQYKTGDIVQTALNDVSLNLRDNEFVSILGPSGSGKTTLLNIIGGLDRYDSGDLIINGISTKEYKDKDWDAYRSHTIGFVFQSYNLIQHQSVLANVELALTIGGVSRSERRQRAVKALEDVGLKDHINKKPNQLSGGQMQRVAIARALVNDPDILLADEPTGALDSETSVQIMELLKKVAEDKLVIMVTHNPELAQMYSTRTVNVKDGRIVGDSDPYDPGETAAPANTSLGKAKMDFPTALALSFNNLKTKKGRTFLTSFAGSIGIIGISLILALSHGVNDYIAKLQKDTMTSYPITITEESFDLASIMNMSIEEMKNSGADTEVRRDDGVYASFDDLKSEQQYNTSISENDLTGFKKYLDDPDSEIHKYLGENGVVYGYDVSFEVFARDPGSRLINTNTSVNKIGKASAYDNSGDESASVQQARNFSELIAGSGGQAVSAVVTDNYDLVYGQWCGDYDEVVIVLDSGNAVSSEQLYQLGFITGEEYLRAKEAIENGREAEEIKWNYEDICSKSFWLLPACDRYTRGEDGLFTFVDGKNEKRLLENALELKVTGIIRPKEDAKNADIYTPAAYTSKLTDYLVEHTNESDVVKAQEAAPDVNILTGVKFDASDEQSKIEVTTEYINGLSASEKANLYYTAMFAGYIDGEAFSVEDILSEGGMQGGSAQDILGGLSGSDLLSSFGGPDMLSGLAGGMDLTALLGNMPGGIMGMNEDLAAASMFDQWFAENPDKDFILMVYDTYIAGSSYEDNMKMFGQVSYDAPSSIMIYIDTFEAKEKVTECIDNYNKNSGEGKQIKYTDYVAVIASSVTQIVDVVSYILIAFVAVSLIVSCIMIGIITHISVLERTKEIGILRALGASKKNISQVFNAETFIIGLFSGLLGITATTVMLIPIRAVIEAVSKVKVNASLPIHYAIALVLISMGITVFGGLVPAKKAAQKDPVIALRTE